MTTTIETHPYNRRETVPDGTCLLIVGTAPPPRFSNPACGGMRPGDFDFFYGSHDNFMWRPFLPNIAFEIERKELFPHDSSPEDRYRIARDFLRRHNIWMKDVLDIYQRRDGKECLADDKFIIAPRVEDCTCFTPIFEAQPCLGSVVFTSKQAAEWTFRKLQHEKLISGEYADSLSQWKEISRELLGANYYTRRFKEPVFQSPIKQRTVGFYILPSPTGRSGRGNKGLTKLVKQDIYKHVLFMQQVESHKYTFGHSML